jgi:hypothetical protein
MENTGTRTSTTINVESDPRLTIPQKAILDTYTASKQMEQMTQLAADAVKQLVESKMASETFSKNLKKEDKEKYKEELKEAKDINKKIDSLIALYIGSVDKRQGITRNPEVTVMQRIGSARWYSGTRPNGLTETERTLMQHAKTELNAALTKTNAFYAKNWVEYTSKMQAISLPTFKETTIFKLN